MSWETGKPIYDRLPGAEEGYRIDEEAPGHNPEECPPVARWLTTPWDELLIELRGRIDGFPADALDPLTADEANLDWLAQFAGFTRRYWNANYPVAAKRQLIANAYEFLWPMKGTKAVIEWLIELFELDAEVYSLGAFRCNQNVIGDRLGGGALNYWVRTPLGYLRTFPQWILLEQINQLYGPAAAESSVVYDGFYCNFSVCGDPLFS
jgi:hypothetical protein